MPIVTQLPLTLAFLVQDITTALLTFNRLEVFRSRTGADGIYDAAMAAAAAPAVLTARNRQPHQLSGKTLSILVNGAVQVDVTFAGPDPYTTAAVIADIIGATALVTPTAGPNTELVLTTVATGSASSIKILESEAAPFLGFDTDQASIGLDAYIPLVVGDHEYRYTDQNADPSFFYKWRLRHSISMQVSEFSVPIPGSEVLGLDYDTTIGCFFKTFDMQGRPIKGRRATIANQFLPNLSNGGGVFRHFLELVTNDVGYAETRLIRGMQVDFSIEGTNFVRRLQIPTVGDIVDLFDPALVVMDEFGIQEPNIDFAIRLS